MGGHLMLRYAHCIWLTRGCIDIVRDTSVLEILLERIK